MSKTLLEQARELLEELVDEDDCQLDHHGDCQAHGAASAPCPHARAKEFLSTLDVERIMEALEKQVQIILRGTIPSGVFRELLRREVVKNLEALKKAPLDYVRVTYDPTTGHIFIKVPQYIDLQLTTSFAPDGGLNY